MPDIVEIRYSRPPRRVQIFRQHLVCDAPDVKVTLARAIEFPQTMRVAGEVALEDGSDVVWFTFPGAWHDIGRFHRADGTFTGLYANVLTPVHIDGTSWQTTDLYLDVWVTPDGRVTLLDEDEFDEAVGRRLIDAETAARTRLEAERLVAGAEDGSWPPEVVHEWTRERALAALDADG